MGFNRNPTGAGTLSPKEYSIFDKRFMAFGSICNLLQGTDIPQDKLDETIKELWNLSGDLVREAMETGLTNGGGNTRQNDGEDAF